MQTSRAPYKSAIATLIVCFAIFAFTALVILRILTMRQEGWRFSWTVRVAES